MLEKEVVTCPCHRYLCSRLKCHPQSGYESDVCVFEIAVRWLQERNKLGLSPEVAENFRMKQR